MRDLTTEVYTIIVAEKLEAEFSLTFCSIHVNSP